MLIQMNQAKADSTSSEKSSADEPLPAQNNGKGSGREVDVIFAALTQLCTPPTRGLSSMGVPHFDLQQAKQTLQLLMPAFSMGFNIIILLGKWTL